MAEARGIRQVAYVDCKGGGQIEVVNGTAYVGHTVGMEATTIIDVRDPKTRSSLTNSAAPTPTFTPTRSGSPTG